MMPNSSVLLETDLGHVVIDLFGEESPLGVENFLRLCEIGYYVNNLFFKVQKDFIALCGDPTGTGNEGESFNTLKLKKDSPVELEEVKEETWKGILLCSLTLPNKMIHSQFFFTLSDAESLRFSHLKGKHTVLGRVVEDPNNFIKTISNCFIDESDRPLLDIRLRRTIILVYPPNYEKLSELQSYQNLVPQPKLDIPNREWDLIEERPSCLSTKEDIEAFEEDTAKKERLLAESRAVKLEILGDIISADAKPEDNVLFVCKLNPITTSENLQLIFSRFGDITDCEVKRDPVTKESLQYAFIHFANKENCEEAYRKMQDVLVDGRRIKVDFSQSAGKKQGVPQQKEEKVKKDHNKSQDDKSRHTDREKTKERKSSKQQAAEENDEKRQSRKEQGKDQEHKHHRHERKSSKKHDSDSDQGIESKKKRSFSSSSDDDDDKARKRKRRSPSSDRIRSKHDKYARKRSNERSTHRRRSSSTSEQDKSQNRALSDKGKRRKRSRSRTRHRRRD